MMRTSIFIRTAFVACLSFCFVTLFAQSYKPPVFTDPDRLKRIETTYAVIDKIYHDYAERNHFPGLVYGIVVDGKLVHTGN
ncbi:MAG: hypothetical protein ACXVA2_22560, partial [Mucilaginibacter sp.]